MVLCLKKRKFLFLLILLASGQLLAFEDNGLIENPDENLESAESLQGMVFDRTITQTGFSFHQLFAQQWLANALSRSHSLTIRETPTARSGSIIWIEEGTTLLYKLSIGLRNKAMDEKAEETFKIVASKLGDNQNIINLEQGTLQ